MNLNLNHGMEHSLAGIRGRYVAGTGREEQGKVVGEEWKGKKGVRAGKYFQTPLLETSFSV